MSSNGLKSKMDCRKQKQKLWETWNKGTFEWWAENKKWDIQKYLSENGKWLEKASFHLIWTSKDGQKKQTFHRGRHVGGGGYGNVFEFHVTGNATQKLVVKESILSSEKGSEKDLLERLKNKKWCEGVIDQRWVCCEKDEESGQFVEWSVMPWMDGSLSTLLNKKRIEDSNVPGIVTEIAKQLKCLHDQGEFYTDIKLENVLYNCDQKSIHLCDLGSVNVDEENDSVASFPPPETWWSKEDPTRFRYQSGLINNTELTPDHKETILSWQVVAGILVPLAIQNLNIQNWFLFCPKGEESELDFCDSGEIEDPNNIPYPFHFQVAQYRRALRESKNPKKQDKKAYSEFVDAINTVLRPFLLNCGVTTANCEIIRNCLNWDWECRPNLTQVIATLKQTSAPHEKRGIGLKDKGVAAQITFKAQKQVRLAKNHVNEVVNAIESIKEENDALEVQIKDIQADVYEFLFDDNDTLSKKNFELKLFRLLLNRNFEKNYVEVAKAISKLFKEKKDWMKEIVWENLLKSIDRLAEAEELEELKKEAVELNNELKQAKKELREAKAQVSTVEEVETKEEIKRVQIRQMDSHEIKFRF